MAYNFSQNAAQNIVKATKKILQQGSDQTGSPLKTRSFGSPFFLAKIGDHDDGDDSTGGSYKYAWTAQMESDSDYTLEDNTDYPISGTLDGSGDAGGDGGDGSDDDSSGDDNSDDGNWAVNTCEQTSQFKGMPPVSSGTIVRLERRFDNADPPNVIFRFSQPPDPIFQVTLTADDEDETTDITYKVLAMDGTTVLVDSGASPTFRPYSDADYSAGSSGIATCSGGSVQLLMANETIQTTEGCVS